MSNKNQTEIARELIKPQNSLLDNSKKSEVESLCEGFTFSCYQGYGVTCGKFSDVSADDDIIF